MSSHPFPHLYSCSAGGRPEGTVTVSSADLPSLETAAPAEFGGPGDRWSPETLLVGAIADCFILSFRAIARFSKLEWQNLECEARATLDRVDKTTRFTHVELIARLDLPEGADPERAERLLQKAEASCLVTSSMTADLHLETEIRTGASVGG